jgi:NADH:ubiquinone oxidoreductase subunit C
MTSRAETLVAAVQATLGDKLASVATALGEVTVMVKPEHLLDAAAALRDAPDLKFEQLTDLSGVDYGGYGKVAWSGTPMSEGGAGAPLAGGAPETDKSPPSPSMRQSRPSCRRASGNSSLRGRASRSSTTC